MAKPVDSLLTRLVFSEFLWGLTAFFAKPHEWVVAERMRIIFGDGCSTSLEASESHLP